MDEHTQQVDAVLNALPVGVFSVDTKGIFQQWNPAMEALTGYTASEVQGRSCSILRCDACGDQPCSFDAATCDLLQTGNTAPLEARIYRKDGTTVSVIKAGRVLRNSAGDVVGAVESFTDLAAVRSPDARGEARPPGQSAQQAFHGLVGDSPAMKEVFRLIELAGASSVNILIHGETGTGKELVARAIHELSSRREGPFVTVNCAALSESLLESELFGHVRGAFTGALRDHAGRFELANGGTLLLDEIGEISPAMQVRLLRVLQERRFERVGESTSRPVDVRIVAATHRDILGRVRDGVFREDLYYRLKVFPIALPPLRKRKQDVPLLLRHFIRQLNERTGKSILGLTQDALRIALDYCWPGNVRELENAVAHAFVTCPGGHIGPFDLPVEIRRVELKRVLCGEHESMPEEPPARPDARAKALTRSEMIELLDACDWNKAEVARRLGLARTSVWRRMKQLGIPMSPDADS